MSKGTIKKFFAGGNTVNGFYSLFHYIPRPEDTRLVVIKGGPGTGKSTLMKQIGRQAVETGLDVELFYCSSDNESLDGVAIPALGFAMVDGTAPHVIDPRIPGAYDEIVNLGDNWDTNLLRSNREAIAALISQNGGYFAQAYHYLKEAGIVMEKMRYLMAQAMDFSALGQITHGLLTDLAEALPKGGGPPRQRHLFAGAITPAGLVNEYPSILQGIDRFYLLAGDPGSGKSTLLRQIYETVLRAGHDVDVYRCAFDPERFDAVVIPVLNTAFVKVTYPHSFNVAPTQPVREQVMLSLSRYTRPASLRATAAERVENQERFWYLIGKAVEMIRASKRNHDQLEEYYIRAMDFARVGKVRDQLAESVFVQPENSQVAVK